MSVLGDHKRVKKRLIPPFLASSIPFAELSWVDSGVPELIWIACLHKVHGLRLGTELAAAFAKTIQNYQKPQHMWAATCTNLGISDYRVKIKVKKELERSGQLTLIVDGLKSLIRLYPKTPFRYLISGKWQSTATKVSDLLFIKSILLEIMDKTSRDATLVIGTALYLGAVCERLQVPSGTALADLPELIDYPDTPRSQIIASSARATVQFLYSPETAKLSPEWQTYFWRRSFLLEECETDKK